MKICTITCYNFTNHGAALQAYALSKWLADKSHNVKIINYQPGYLGFYTHLWYLPNTIKEFGKLLLQYSDRKDIIQRHSAHLQFANDFLPLTATVYSEINDLRQDPPLADVYIAGSDQIWNTDFPNGKDDAFYLKFGGPNTRRISYAASFAIDKIPDEIKSLVKDGLQNLDVISVRESSALSMLKDLGFSGVQVCDPVFLLNPDTWSKIGDGTGKGEKYVLIYDFERSKEIKNIAKRIAKLRGLKIYSISPRRLRYADKHFSHSGPQTFISLIENAECVISNSFHGTAFSLIFNKDFFIVNRTDGLNARMRDIVTKYNLSERIVDIRCTNAQLVHNINYESVNNIIWQDIAYSKNWLSKSIST